MKNVRVKPAFVLLVLSLSAGCASYRPAPIHPGENLSRFESRTLGNPALEEFVRRNSPGAIPRWPPRKWDLALLTASAFYYHPDLDVARARWGVAKAAVITAGQRPNPGVGVVPEYNANSASGISPWILGFSLDIPLETAGRRGYRIARAGDLSRAARFHVAAAAWRVRSRLRKRLLDLFAAVRTETILERRQTVQGEIVEATEKRLAAGEISRLEVTRARISRDRTVLLLREARKRIAEARVAVADAVGVPAAALEGIDISFPFPDGFPANPPSGEVRREALLNRPDILASLAEYEASQSSLRLEISRQYPDLRLGPGYKWDQGDNKWSLGFSVSLPVFHHNQGPIAEAEARRTESAARFTALQARVIGESDRALAGYRESLGKLDAADTLLASQRARRKSEEALFNAGEADRLAFLGARLEMEAGELARLESLVEAQKALGLLEDAVERPLVPAEEFPSTP